MSSIFSPIDISSSSKISSWSTTNSSSFKAKIIQLTIATRYTMKGMNYVLRILRLYISQFSKSKQFTIEVYSTSLFFVSFMILTRFKKF